MSGAPGFSLLELRPACQRDVSVSEVITLMPELLCHCPHSVTGFGTSDQAQRKRKLAGHSEVREGGGGRPEPQ